MSARFVACPACARHVRVGECVCPFCGAKAACAKPLRRMGGRLTRAAMQAAGAAGTAIVLADCTSGPTIEPAYGIACTPDVCAPIYEDSGADSAAEGGVDVTEAATSDASPADAPGDVPDGE